ncbi:hypothetical protein [Streptomyces sp. GESEQ-35]|nr:hypothetical protein [Streptomyces sp. GESEQ-35]
MQLWWGGPLNEAALCEALEEAAEDPRLEALVRTVEAVQVSTALAA